MSSSPLPPEPDPSPPAAPAVGPEPSVERPGFRSDWKAWLAAASVAVVIVVVGAFVVGRSGGDDGSSSEVVTSAGDDESDGNDRGRGAGAGIPGAGGTVAEIDGSTLVVESEDQSGEISTVTVETTGDTVVTETVAGSLSDLAVGDNVVVTGEESDGGGRTLRGEVVNVGQAVSSQDAITYPVTIAIVGDTTGMRNGSLASVAIRTDGATDVLAIPTSAVINNGGGYAVEVLRGDDLDEIEVEIGAIGDTWTEITDGLEAGQTVVVADLDEPLPGSATDGSSTTEPGGFPGGFGGGPPGG